MDGVSHGDTIYTRVYSSRNAGQLSSGKGSEGPPLSTTQLHEEFRKHANLYNNEPTALVSVSNRIIDTLRRALVKYFRDGESPTDIWIAFINVPATRSQTPPRTHAAEQLAEYCGLTGTNSGSFRYETVFEWTVPEDCVLHEICLQTLMDRGLLQDSYIEGFSVDHRLPSTSALKSAIGEQFENSFPWEVGMSLGYFAQRFGARAPVRWIALQLFHDCARWSFVEDQVYTYGPDFFRLLKDGIGDYIIDWLADSDFVADHQEFEDWKEIMEDTMIWDLIDFWETWCRDRNDSRSRMEQLCYERALETLEAKHRILEAQIEAEGVRIGL